MDNPLDERFKTLSDGWAAFMQAPTAPRLCRWTLKAPEYWMVDTLLSYENGPEAHTDAFFVTLRSPCRSASEYWLFLTNELSSWVNAYVTNEANLAKQLRWTHVFVASSTDAPGRFLRMLTEFAGLIAPYHLGPLVVSLLPGPGTDDGVFSRFLYQLVSQPLPASLRLLVRDDVAKPALDSLAKSLGKAMYTQFMDMRLPEYVTKITSGGDPNDPANKIRAYQKELSLALAPNRKDIPEAERIAVHSLKICDDQKWYSLAASIHVALAYAYFELKQDKEATARYGLALDITEPAYKNGDTYAGYTSAIAWLGLASIEERDSNRTQIETLYLQATDRAIAVQEPIMAVNCLKTLAQWYRKWGKPRQENEQYERLFSLADTLTPTQRVYVKLPEIGSAYYAQLTTHDQRRVALARLRGLLGHEWMP